MSHPAVDVVTDRVAVILQEREVVPITSWVADAMRVCGASGRGLQIVTPARARITLPLRQSLGGGDGRWVARDPAGEGYYDALSGVRLEWRDEAFVPIEDGDGGRTMSPAFASPGESAAYQLAVTFRVRRPATDTLVLGAAIEAVFVALTGAPPAGWGTSEPAGLPWSRTELTALCRTRAPAPTWLVVVGGGDRPAVATMRVGRTESGVYEQVVLAAGYHAEEAAPLVALPEIVQELVVEHELVTFMAQRRPGRRDTTVPARWEGMPAPVGLAVGPEAISGAGLEQAMRPPGLPYGRRIGRRPTAAIWYELGDGQSSDSWAALEGVVRHLYRGGEIPPEVARSPG